MNQLTAAEAAKVLGVSKQSVWKIFKAARRAGNVNLYDEEEILSYRDHRYRTKLAKCLGWMGRGLYKNEDVDTECPIQECDAFAVEWPPAPLLPNKTLCLSGHKIQI